MRKQSRQCCVQEVSQNIVKSVWGRKEMFLVISVVILQHEAGDLRHHRSWDELWNLSAGSTRADWVGAANPGLQCWGLDRSQGGHGCSQLGCADVILDAHMQRRHQTFNYRGFMYNFIILAHLHVCRKTKTALSNPIKAPKPKLFAFLLLFAEIFIPSLPLVFSSFSGFFSVVFSTKKK